MVLYKGHFGDIHASEGYYRIEFTGAGLLLDSNPFRAAFGMPTGSSVRIVWRVIKQRDTFVFRLKAETARCGDNFVNYLL